MLAEYFNYNNIFLVENIATLPEYTRINNHIIKLKKIKQLFFNSLYSLKLIKLKIIKTYTK